MNVAVKWKGLWKLPLPKKITLILWKILVDCILVKKELQNKNITNDAVCPLCRMKEEMIEHLFFKCDFSRGVCFGPSLSIRCQDLFQGSYKEWLENVVENYFKRKDVEYQIIVPLATIL